MTQSATSECLFVTACSMDEYAEEKRTEKNLIVRSGISEAETINNTRSSAVAERPRDASCLSVVSFNIQHSFFLLLVTAASDLLVHKILLNSVLLSPVVSGGVRPNLPGQTPLGHNPIVFCRYRVSWVRTPPRGSVRIRSTG